MPRLFSSRIAAVMAAIVLSASVPSARAPRLSATLETSAVSVINDVAEATFKVIVHNEDTIALTDVWLVFEDGFDVAIGDIDPESARSSDSKTKTFDLSKDGGTAHVPFPATVKYDIDGQPGEQAITVVLVLKQ